MNLFALLKDGGFVMVPLIVCSLAVWAVVFEKAWGLGQFKKQYKTLHAKAYELVKANRIDEAKGLFQTAGPLIAAPHLVLFEEKDLRKDLRDEKVQRRLSETQAGLRKFLWVLGTIGSSAPFIGLFGTVVGIIKSFDSIAASGKSGFSVVAAGLSEALIATAAGIFVAVVAVMFYNYFQTKLQNLNLEFRNRLEDLADLLE